MRLLVTDPALQALRQATAWLITTLGRNRSNNKPTQPNTMTLALDNSRWLTLATAYGSDSEQVVGWLREAYAHGMQEEMLGDLINEIQHQGDTSEAMYAVAPHLLALAETAESGMARQLDIHAGLIHCASQVNGAVQCPEDLKVEFMLSASIGKHRIAGWIQTAEALDDFKYAVAALAGFLGHGRFGFVIEGVEFYNDQFYHAGVDDPIPGA
ncbi:MAG: hypothetical protein Q8Q84_12530 [Hydrogenophaga sp.]|nr:hypothetical protein [Hydrogenophaga sp.]MDP3924175.1 hypothetical protein [Hydrogenophaga sp.]